MHQNSCLLQGQEEEEEEEVVDLHELQKTNSNPKSHIHV
jgi:hypothetical protein